MDERKQIYKKLVVNEDGSRLLGGILIGDADDYGIWLQMMLDGTALPANPEELILPASRGGVELGRNVRPNRDYAYGDTQVPPGGSLVLAAGVVFHPLPAAGDEVRIEVVATLMDGRTARHGSAVTVAP